MKKIITLLAACLLFSSAQAVGLTNSPLFQIRLVLDTPSADSESMSVSYNVGTNSVRQDTFIVQTTPLFDINDVKSAASTQVKRAKTTGLEITFTDQARKRWADFTGANVGKRVAIILEVQLNSAPVLKSGIPGGKIQIVSNQGVQETTKLIAAINAAIPKR